MCDPSLCPPYFRAIRANAEVGILNPSCPAEAEDAMWYYERLRCLRNLKEAAVDVIGVATLRRDYTALLESYGCTVDEVLSQDLSRPLIRRLPRPPAA